MAIWRINQIVLVFRLLQIYRTRVYHEAKLKFIVLEDQRHRGNASVTLVEFERPYNKNLETSVVHKFD